MEILQAESPSVGKLITSSECATPYTSVQRIADNFFNSAHLDAVALVEGREPIGLVTRPKLLFTLFKRFGFELYGRKPVITIADIEPLTIHEDERLDVAIDKALDRPAEDIYDEIIVVDDDGYYKGLISVKHMVIQQSNALANSMVQKEIAETRIEELENIEKIKSQFIANVTHELRSPVNAIIGLAELMKMSCEKGYIDQVKDRLTLIMSGATHLRAIITNILDLSKIEAGKMEIIYENFDLMRIVREVAETTKVLLGAKPVAVTVNSEMQSLQIVSDPVKIKQILTNLMGNAAKFTDRGKIMLSVAESDDKLNIRVTDTGIGIRKEDMERLFTAFSQVGDAATKRHEGTGLGLTITKNLLDMLGGDIALNSEFGQGTTFEVTLPIKNNNLNA
ncbi:MAG: CBS domain-containing protein [Nitrospiraceae bacterium]|nr:MAG: CBS domain-containing protein [Nitrospiraceae bacterium]